MNPPPIVFLVEDDDSVRRTLSKLLSLSGYRVRAFPAAEPFLNQPPVTEPACAVLDVGLPGLNGLDLQNALRNRGDQLPVVFVTGNGDIPMTVRAMRQGAEDFLTKPFDNERLLAAIGRGIARHTQALREAADQAALEAKRAALSPRERQVFDLVAAGMPNKAVGKRLGICEKTVKVHRGSVMRKMQANSLADLVRMATRLGIGLETLNEEELEASEASADAE